MVFTFQGVIVLGTALHPKNTHSQSSLNPVSGINGFPSRSLDPRLKSSDVINFLVFADEKIEDQKGVRSLVSQQRQEDLHTTNVHGESRGEYLSAHDLFLKKPRSTKCQEFF